MEMKEGRNFSKDFPSDSTGIILNEAAIKVLGFKPPYTELLYRPGFKDGKMTGAIAYHIVGIIKDFNFASLHQKVSPLIIQWTDSYSKIAIRVNAKDASSIISKVKDKWNAMAPGQPFSYS